MCDMAYITTSHAESGRPAEIQVLTIKEEPTTDDEDSVINASEDNAWSSHSNPCQKFDQMSYNPNLMVMEESYELGLTDKIVGDVEGLEDGVYEYNYVASGADWKSFDGNRNANYFEDGMKYENDTNFSSRNVNFVSKYCDQDASIDINTYAAVMGDTLVAEGFPSIDTEENSEDDDTKVEVTIDTTYKVDDVKKPPKREYKCQICGRMFGKSSNRLRHMLTHTGERAFTCKICGKKFKQNNNLKNHMFVHSEVKLHTCNVCNKSFKLPGHLTQHQRSHTGIKAYKCAICDKSYAKNATLKQHLKMHTGEFTVVDHVYACLHCDDTFAQVHDLNKHMATHASDQPFRCNLCSESFSHSIHLQQHMIIHSGEILYACEFCDRTFTDTSDLKEHVDQHKGDRPYMCDLCPKGFVHVRNLRRHLKGRHSERSTTCTKCGETFAHSSQQERHSCTGAIQSAYPPVDSELTAAN